MHVPAAEESNPFGSTKGRGSAPSPRGHRVLSQLLAERRKRAERSESGLRKSPFVQALRPLAAPLVRARGALADLWTEGRLRVLAEASGLLGAERIVRPLPSFRGVFELDLQSDVTRNLLLGRFERQLVPILEAAVQGGDVVDVGANSGLYTVLAARLLGARGRVLAIEPAPSVLTLLRANLLRNELPNVVIYPGVVAGEAGRATLHVMEGNEEYASLGGRNHPLAPQRTLRAVEVPKETLDNLVLAHGLSPAFIKIDTEGAEGLVLSGAARTLAAHRPVILSELDDRLLAPLAWDAGRVLGLLVDAGYAVYDAYSGKELLDSSLPAPYIGEIVALPR